MKLVMKALGIILLAAIGTGTVIYAWDNCPKRKAENDKYFSELVRKYIENNSNSILEKLAKNENFANTIKNFSSVNDEELKGRILTILQNNPSVFESYVETYGDAVIDKVMSSEEFKNFENKTVAPAESTAEEEKSEEVAQPNPNQIYIDHWDELNNHKAMPSIGPKDAKVTVVEFFDFACGHCKALAPIMERLIQNNKDVKFVFAPLYFMSPHSPYAAKAALAAHKKGKFVEVYDGLLTLPDINEETINQILTDEGLKVDEIKKMVDEKDIRRGIQDIDSLSQVLGINGVPLLLINGENFYGRSLEDLQNKLNSLK